MKKSNSKDDIIRNILLNPLLEDKYNITLPEGGKRTTLGLLWKTASKHRILPLAAHQMLHHQASSLSPQERTALQLLILDKKRDNHLREEALQKVCTKLTEAGIPVMVLKGPALDLNRDKPREYYDLDILIPEKELNRTIETLSEMNYTYQGSFILSKTERQDITRQTKWNNQYPFKSTQSPFSLEVHTNLFERDRVRRENLSALLNRIDLFWEKARWSDKHKAYLPSPESSFILLCYHIALKRSPGEGRFILRHLYDIEHLVYSGLDKDQLRELIEIWDSAYFIRFSVELFTKFTKKKVDLEIPPLSELPYVQKLLLMIHLKCQTDWNRTSPFFRGLYRLMMPLAIGGGVKKSFYWYLESLFPTKVAQERDFGVPLESPWIYGTYLFLPPRWIWRRVLKPLYLIIFRLESK